MSYAPQKLNGMDYAGLVAFGYSQVLKVDFLEICLPVTNDIMYWILLLIMIHFRFLAKVEDVKAVFLYREQEEKICMECLSSMKNSWKDDCVILGKSIWFLVQAAKQ